jgi:predicted HicB family RNase H-like nuclease
MVNINIPIPDELHKKLKLEAVKSDITLKDLIVKKLESQSSTQGGKAKKNG